MVALTPARAVLAVLAESMPADLLPAHPAGRTLSALAGRGGPDARRMALTIGRFQRNLGIGVLFAEIGASHEQIVIIGHCPIAIWLQPPRSREAHPDL